jgi:hypothetical protein
VSTDWRFDGRVLAAEHLPRRLPGVTRVVVRQGTIVTPLAREDLSQRGIIIGHDAPASAVAKVAPTSALWVGSDRDYPFLGLGLRMAGSGLERATVRETAALAADAGRWKRENMAGAAVIFTSLPEMVAWEAGRVSGTPSAAVSGVSQAIRALATLERPILAVEMPGRTAYEIRQILRLADPAGRAA